MSETEIISDIYRCTPRQVRAMTLDCLEAGLVPFIQSSPGMGKSSIIKQIGQANFLKLIDHRLSTSAPEDLSGLPEFYNDTHGIRRARFVPFDIFPVEGTPIPEGFDGWLLFLDEFNAALKAVQAAAYKLTLDKQVGQANLHERVAIVCAGNLSTDRSIVNPLSTAMQSRIIHIEMMISFIEWLEDVAFVEHYDERIIAYLSYKESDLMDFRPDHNEKTFCCPRTWEFMNRLIKGKEVTVDKTPLYAGCITSGVAVSFVQFCSVRENMPNIKQIIRDPTGTDVPTGQHASATKWMIIVHMSQQANEKNFAALCTYANRFGIEFRVLFFRTVLAQKPELRQHPNFAQAMGDVSRYLHGN